MNNSEQMELIPSTLLPAASLVRTCRLQAIKLALVRHAVAYGRNTPVSFTRYDHFAALWKTSQHSLLELEGNGLAAFSGTWPRSGMMQSGIAYQLPPLVPTMLGTGFSSYPTPLASDGKKVSKNLDYHRRRSLTFPSLPSLFALRDNHNGKICPTIPERLMGFPTDWTACD